MTPNNKYQFKIVPQDGGYVGYVMLNNEVIHNTPVCKDTIAASRNISSFISQKTNNAAVPMPKTLQPSVPALRSGPVANPNPANNNASPRRCCGRG